MRVLMQTRTDAERFGGGDVTQVMETAKVLTGLGVEVVFDSRLTARYRDFDIVHLFNTTRINETWQQWRAAVRVGVPVVVSPIWHSVAEMRRYFEWYYRFRPFPIWTYSGLREVYYARRAGFPLAAKCVWGYRRCIREVMEGADALLPNSHAELVCLKTELNVQARRAFVIPYAYNSCENAAHLSRPSPRHGIVCGGRIEPRKNSCRVIEGFRLLGRRDVKLSFYGARNESHRNYLRQFDASLEPGWIEYRGKVSPSEMYHAFGDAEVSALASYFETAGLVGLEAMACGAKVVMMDSPYTRELYQNHVFYCDPYSTESIARALEAALNAPFTQRPEILESLTWERAGRLTLEAYQAVLTKANG